MRAFLRKLWRVITAPIRGVRWLVRKFTGWLKKIRDFLTVDTADRPTSEAFADTVQDPRVILEHFTALRRRLLQALIGLFIAVVFSFIFTKDVVGFLAGPIGGLQALKAIDVTESVGVFMRVALLSGFALASPFIAFELWLFIAPALRPHTRLKGLFAIPLVAVFFLGGMAFAYFILLPPALDFLLNFMGISVIPRPDSYISFVTAVMFWLGVAFEFPLIVYALTSIGLIKPTVLLQNWRIAVLVIAVLAAAVTPTPDPFNMLLVMGPMILLYFIGVWLGYIAAAGRKKNRPA
jgi:sec-independent protein translocase protein TatC